MLKWLDALSADPAAMVRRAVGLALPALVPLVGREILNTTILPIFEKLNLDDQDSVRLLAARLCIDIAQILDETEISEAVLPVMAKGVVDPSWRVRYVFAERFSELQSAFGPTLSRESLLPAFVDLLGDDEPEVRAAAALQVRRTSFVLALWSFLSCLALLPFNVARDLDC